MSDSETINNVCNRLTIYQLGIWIPNEFCSEGKLICLCLLSINILWKCKDKCYKDGQIYLMAVTSLSAILPLPCLQERERHQCLKSGPIPNK